MLFPTVQFAIFFCVVLTASWALMPHPKAWKPFILTASYVFYAAANWRFCALLAALTIANQVAARLIHRVRDDPRRSKQIMAAAIVIDLGVLGIFKYYGFFVEDIGDLLDAAGLGLPLPLLSLALPIGVSFFTFQAISYVVDVRRGLIPPASLFDFAIYLTFFPHLVAGPIVRAREFIPQLATPRKRSDVAVGAAVSLIAVGLVKKVAIADYLAREVVDPVFAVPQAYSAPGRRARLLRLCRADLLRLLRLHGHRDRPGAAHGVRLPAELRPAVHLAEPPRVLAPMAHHALALPARLPLHPARRQPRRGGRGRTRT